MGLLVYAERKADGSLLVHAVFPEGQEHDQPDEYLRAVKHGRNVNWLAADEQEIVDRVKASQPVPVPVAASDGHDHAGEQTTPPAGTPRAAKPQGERKAKKDKKTGTGQAQE